MEKISKEKRSKIMRSIKSKDTKPELEMRRRLLSGFVRGRSFAYNADFCYPDAMVAVFVDGDFWHGKDFSYETSSLSQHWKDHIASNMRRDRRQRESLKRSGWVVFSLWESDIKTCSSFFARVINSVILYRRGIRVKGSQSTLELL